MGRALPSNIATRKRAKPNVNSRSQALKLHSFPFSPARAQSAEADGARARNRTGFFEHDYEQEHEHEKARENMGWVSERLEKCNFKLSLDGITGFRPASPTSVDTDDVRITHPAQVIRGQGRTKTATT